MKIRIAALIAMGAMSGCVGGDTHELAGRHYGKPSRGGEIGFVLYEESLVHFYIPGKRLKPEDSLTVQYPSESGAAQCCRSVSARSLKEAGSAEGDVSDEEGGRSLFHYYAKRDISGQPLLGVVAVNAGIRQPSGGNRLAVTSASGELDVMTCQSSEGVHLFAERVGTRVAHLYYRLEYEVEPTCPPERFEQPESGSAR